MTGLPDIYAGGDLIRQRASVADAAMSGKRAALSIHLKANGLEPAQILPSLALGGGASLSLQAYLEDGRLDLKKVVQFAELNTLRYRKRAALHGTPRPAPRGHLGFREVNGGLDKEAAVAEAQRCFCCGTCIGCDLCFLLCPDISIMKRGENAYDVDRDHCKGCQICATVCPRHVIEMESRG
jgi:Pyruvate/2-oxoacid:ferredoxin oxidoreductase delta subunit